MIKQDSIEKLNMVLDLVDVLGKMDATNIADTGDEVRAFCPIHGSDNQPSLAIAKSTHLGKCHNTSCIANDGGNLIQLYAWAKNLKFDEAAQELADTVGFSLERTGGGTPRIKKDVTPKFQADRASPFCYVEVAHGEGKGFRRNQVIKLSDIADWQKKHDGANCYRTFVRYESAHLSKLYPEGKDETPVVIGNFVMDLDNPFTSAPKRRQNTVFKDIKTFEDGVKCCGYDAKEVIDRLVNDYDVPIDTIIVSFSGRGIHVEVDYRVFGAEPMYEAELMNRYKQIFFVIAEVDAEAEKVVLEWDPDKGAAAKLAFKAKYQTADIAMYSKKRLWRLANSLNTKSKLLKVDIPTGEFLKRFADVSWILSFAKQPQSISSFPTKVIPSSKAVHLFENAEQVYQAQVDAQKEAVKQAKAEAAKIKLPESAWRGIFAMWRDAYGKTTEAANEFLFAGLLTITGAMLGRRAYAWMANELYPNIYAVVVGDTAKARKTTAVNYAERTLKDTDPHVWFSSGISTTQGLISMLQFPGVKALEEFDEARKENPDIPMPKKIEIYLNLQSQKRLSYEGFRLLYYEREFSSLLKKAKSDVSTGLIETLTSAYDMPPELDNHTLTNPMSAPKTCVSVLGSTTFGKLQRRLMAEEIEGGFANRFMYFVGDRKPPDPRPPRPDKKIIADVMGILNRATQKWTHTEFDFTDDAAKLWDGFYCEEYSREYDSITLDEINARLTTHALKIALIYAATENDEAIITTEQMQAAIDIAEYLRQSAVRIFALRGGTKASRLETLIIDFLNEQDGKASQSEMLLYLKSKIMDVTAKDAKVCLDSMAAMNLIVKQKESFKDSLGRTRQREFWTTQETELR